MKFHDIYKFFTLAMILFLICPAAGFSSPPDTEQSYDWGIEGAVTETAGLVANIIQLTSSEYSDAYPAWGSWCWNSDGTGIVYQSERGSDEGEICVINVDGTGFARLTFNDRCDSHPSYVWPNDGKIVFQRNVEEVITGGETVNHGEIWIMDADGSDQTSLTQAHGGPVRGPGSCENKPKVSPDGLKVAFRGCSENGLRKNGDEDAYVNLYVMNIDGSNPVKVAGGNGLTEISHHVWGPAGQWLAFKATEENGSGDARIFKVKADGTGLAKVSPEDGKMPPEWNDFFCQNWPAWSPDGKWIAASTLTGADYGYKAVMIMDPDGGEMKTVMAQDGDNDGDDYDWIHSGVSWSPNSRWVTYSMDTISNTVICASNIYTDGFLQLTDVYDACQPRWSPDPMAKPGRILYKSAGRHPGGGANELFVVNPAPWALDEVDGSGRNVFDGGGTADWGGAGMKLQVQTGAGGEAPLFIGARYVENPTPELLGGSFWDLYCPDPANVVTATLTLYFNNYQSNTRYMWFDEDAGFWKTLSRDMYEVTQGPFTVSGVQYNAAIVITITDSTIPDLNQLKGTVFSTSTIAETYQEAIKKHNDGELDCFVKTVSGSQDKWPFFAILALGLSLFIRRAKE